MIRIITLFVFIFLSNIDIKAQILEDKEGMQLIQNGIDKVYNYDFAGAEKITALVEKKYPQHPVVYLMKTFQMYWQYLPIQENKAQIPAYIKVLNDCLAATERTYKNNPDHPEAIFFTMASRGFMAIMYNYQKEHIKAVTEARKAYKQLIDGMKYTKVTPDFLFTTGMYNYYVEAYPETTPIVKPMMIFFKKGNKTLGLQQLEEGAKKAVITPAENHFNLVLIYLEHESNLAKAHQHTSILKKEYPNNPIFLMKFIETLIARKQLVEAKKENEKLKNYTSKISTIAHHFFNGRLAEEELNDAKAETSYKLALSKVYDQQFTKEYHAMSYAGLARIAHRKGDKSLAKSYYKKCLEIATYKTTIQEAKKYN